jgi:S-DNA-T family DNA segregation ATPase FtsK/SpoIIIE
MANKYEMQAARIETVLGAHKVPARVWQATVTPRFVRFDVTTALGTRLTKVSSLAEELAFALGARATRVYREGGVLHVEVPLDTARTVPLLPLCSRLQSVPPYCAVLGIDEGGAPLLLRLDSPDVAHVLVAGTTGSGKTALARTLLLSLAMHNHPGQLQISLIDPKGRGLGVLAGLPHIWRGAGVAQDSEAAVALLTALVEEMSRRDAAARSLPRLVVAVDELADLLQTGGKPVADALTRLTQRGREAGIHVVAATQRPSAALVGGLMKANFPVRLVGSVVSPEDAKVAAGVAGSEAERLLGRGDFLLITKGQMIRFQAAYAGDDELAATVARVRGGGRRRRRWDLDAQPARRQGDSVEAVREPALAEPPEGSGTGSWGRMLTASLSLPPNNWGRT